MPEHYRGRLELTWTNKHQCLLAHEDGSYEWVPPTDYRIAEVRLLRMAGAVGEADAGQNLLVRGDALSALNSLCELASFADRYVGSVKLAYLDPPFNTRQSFLQYDDALEHSVWLTMLRDRLGQIKRLLSDDGSVWVHLDDREAHRCRCVLDEVFGLDCFVTEVIWESTDARKMDAQQFSLAHNRLLVYSRKPGWSPTRYPGEADPKAYPHLAPDGHRYSRRELRKWGKNSLRADRPNLWYPVTAPDGSEIWPIRPDGKEGCWRWQKSTLAEAADRIDWVATERGLEPYVMTFMDDGKKPKPPRTLWTTEWMPGNPAARQHLKELLPDREPFDTPKPEELLREIVYLATSAGDIVLDCFLGSATTAAVAHKMGRRWIGVERSRKTLDDFAIPRLAKVIRGEDAGGVTAEVGWGGGGGFQIFDVGPSMFEDDEGVVMLAEWATNSALAEATAAQLGYAYQAATPFCGRKGRSRLAVIDGLVSPTVIGLLLGALDEGELLTVCGTSVDPDAAEVLRSRRPGSRVRKIPASLLTEYQEATRWRPRVATAVDETARTSASGSRPLRHP